MNQREWTIEEDEYIKNNFGNKTFSEMAKYIGCAITTVQNRARFLGFEVEKKTARRWTEEEISLLTLMAPKYLNKTIARKLNRSINELNKKARELGIKLIFKRPVWKNWKVKFLKENINILSLSQIQKELEVNYYQIMDKLDELGIEYDNNFWSDEEVNILTELSSKVYIRELAKILNRTEEAIISKANKMGIEYITLKRKYTEEELNYIKDNWGIIPVSDMARALKVSRIMIQTQADQMNLRKLGNNPYKKWTQDEIDKLQRLSKTKTITELAKYFKTTNNAIITIANRRGIELIDSKILWTEEDNKTLKELAKTMDISEIAIAMGRNTSAIRLQAKRQNIELIPNKKYRDSIWTEENTKQLKKLASDGKTILEIATIMNKKDQTISKKAREFGINISKDETRSWTEDDINKLKELAKTKKLSELVKELNRTSSSIKSIAKSKGIKILTDRKNWTEEEYQLLEKLIMIDKKSPKEVAEILGRTEDAITIKVNRRGLQIQTNDKKFWNKEEETLLSDLWGTLSLEKISNKLNRSVSSIKNKAFQLGLESYIESNYEGLTMKDISDLLNIDINTISISWVSLGLKYKVQQISKSKSYRYVEIKDLYEFLEANQNIWDSRNLEKNILGIEPNWLVEKRKRDKQENPQLKNLNLTKQQLIFAKKFFLEMQERTQEQQLNNNDKNAPRLVKMRNNIPKK